MEGTADIKEQVIDETTGETQEVTTTVDVYRAVVTNDITKLPFTIEVEHSTQIIAVEEDDYGVKKPGEGYLKVTVNWIGDNDLLDSEWGYKVGEYLEQYPDEPAMTVVLSIDSYQVDPRTNAEIPEPVFPSTATTRPYLPEGYKRVLGTTLDSGLVIEDASGNNQYVWIEVPKSNEVYSDLQITNFSNDSVYDKIENELRAYVGDYSARKDVHLDFNAIGLSPTNYKNLKHKVLKSIYNYGGFYIGRYETGIIDAPRTAATPDSTPTETPVIKSNAYPFNYITLRQANTKASTMAPTGYTSSILFGLQWDLVLKYLETKNTPKEWLDENSISWGNYTNSEYILLNKKAKYIDINSSQWLSTIPYQKNADNTVLTTTGANSGMCRQNIYDLAGNLAEWTFDISQQGNTTTYIGGNGGSYCNYGGINFSTTRDAIPTTANDYGKNNTGNGYSDVGFRVLLISNTDIAEPWGDNGTN